VTGWAVDGVELPFGSGARQWWIGANGEARDRPLPDAELLPGRFVLPGLADAHAHPALGVGQTGPLALDQDSARANLITWAQAGVALVRDVGSPAGLSLDVQLEPGMPLLLAAGRFMAPAGRYFPQLLVNPVEEPDLADAALAEIARGARWIKVICDFPDLVAQTAAEPTYSADAIARLVDAAHKAGARVAAHTTTANAAAVVAAGVDSIEHGTALDEAAVREMARRGTAWTPTLGATIGFADRVEVPPETRDAVRQIRDRLAHLIPLAVRLGVPVLAGTDVVGSLPQEVALLAQLGLAPGEALAAASVWVRQFVGTDASADIVTYHHDPREDPDLLAEPAAVVVGGTRLR
jgi:imidazolonepropionase-like amidohydrolase